MPSSRVPRPSTAAARAPFLRRKQAPIRRLGKKWLVNGWKTRRVITDDQGTLLVIEHSAANVRDSEAAMPIVDAAPPLKTIRGGRRKRPKEALAEGVDVSRTKAVKHCVVEESSR